MDEPRNCPIWFNGKDILEAVFCEEFMSTSWLMKTTPFSRRTEG